MHKVKIGKVVSGTTRTRDLLRALADKLEEIANDAAPTIVAEARSYAGSAREYDSDAARAVLSDLITCLGELAPPYCYFGAHPGDGAEHGFWLSEGWDEEFDGLRVADTSEVPGDYSGEVLHVSDHGNVTLYSAEKGKLTEVWAVV